MGNLINPAIKHHLKTKLNGKYRYFLSRKQEVGRSREEAKHWLCTPTILLQGRIVSSSFSSFWVKKRWVPLEKFEDVNIIKYPKLMKKMEALPSKAKFHFLDKKHLINKGVLPNKT